MTDCQLVYDAFLGKMLDDEWENWNESEMIEDFESLLKGAISYFKFPRVDLAISGSKFVNDLNNDEIQILATYMKCEWLNRTILTWENVKPLYHERDFSQANLLDKFNQMLAAEKKNAARLESKYYRSIDYKPYAYSKWASKVNG